MEHLNHGVSGGLPSSETPKALQFVNCQMLLCRKCNTNQSVKIKQLASFIPRDDVSTVLLSSHYDAIIIAIMIDNTKCIIAFSVGELRWGNWGLQAPPWADLQVMQAMSDSCGVLHQISKQATSNSAPKPSASTQPGIRQGLCKGQCTPKSNLHEAQKRLWYSFWQFESSSENAHLHIIFTFLIYVFLPFLNIICQHYFCAPCRLSCVIKILTVSIKKNILFPTELLFYFFSHGGHPLTGPRLPDMCFPSFHIFRWIAGPAYFNQWPADTKWRGHSTKAQALQRIHPRQRKKWRRACVAESAGADPRQGSRKCQAGVAVRKRQPAGCSLCWPVDLSHCYLLCRACEVSSHHLCYFLSFPRG